MTETISTVLLDADGVVQLTPPGWLGQVGELCGRAGSVDAFLEDVFAAEKPTLTGAGPFRPALAEVLERWQSPASVAEAIQIWHQIEPQAGVLEQVAELRGRGLRVALATNQQPERAQFMTRSLGYQEHFDDLFYSCDLGHAKPDPAYFEAALERLGEPGSAVLFVDDNAGNVAAAAGVGLHARQHEPDSGARGLAALLAEFGLS